jgi:hypothetical protein
MAEHALKCRRDPTLSFSGRPELKPFVPLCVVVSLCLYRGCRMHPWKNLLNYAAFGNPSVDPTNTNFEKVTTAVAAAGAMRFFSFGMRFSF